MLDQLRMAVPAAPEPRRRGDRPRGTGGPGGGGPRAAGAGALALALWAGMTGPQHWADPATWAIGGAAALAVAGLVWRTPPPAGPRLRLSVWGGLRLSVWFAGQAVRGAVDVARRAFDPALPVAPGWYRHPLRLPPGAPRLVMANAVTLLPGTLTAELRAGAAGDPAGGSAGNPAGDPAEGCHLIVHLLDVRADPGPDLAALEARVRGLFALRDPAGPAPAGAVLPDPLSSGPLSSGPLPSGPLPSGPAPVPPGSGLPVVVPAPSSRPKDRP